MQLNRLSDNRVEAAFSDSTCLAGSFGSEAPPASSYIGHLFDI